MSHIAPLDARLSTIAALVRPNRKLADIGSDHAYLPIFLCQKNIIPSALATDINQGPLQRARKHILDAGMEKRIETKLCDGLKSLEKTECEEFTICGMGGDLIARMIEKADFVRNPDIHLILQPMTAQGTLRAYLWTHGFDIAQEHLCQTDRIYQVFSVFYTGKNTAYTPLEQLIGKYHIAHPHQDPLLPSFLIWQHKFIAARMHGKMRGGLPYDTEDCLLHQIEKLLHTVHVTENNSVSLPKN